jgi:hypothetical protein
MLSIDENEFNFDLSDNEHERQDAKSEIIRGALQITASRLASQRTQEAAGISEMLAGVRAIL